MTSFDYAILLVLALSCLLGAWRGLVSEVLSFGAWLVAGWTAWKLCADIAPWLSAWVQEGALQIAAGFVVIFVAVLLLLALVRFLLRELLHAVGLGPIDRLLGAVFGLARGLLIALLVVMLGGLTRLPKEPWWQEAVLSRPLEIAVVAGKHWLPDMLAQRIRYR